MNEKESKEAIKIIKSLIKDYPYEAEACENNKGKPCKRCNHVLVAKNFIDILEKKS
jgi:hypothetical protein